MSKKIFFFDIDGTLAVKNIIPEDTKEALRKLQNLGHYVFIVPVDHIFTQNIILKNMLMVLFVQMVDISCIKKRYYWMNH